MKGDIFAAPEDGKHRKRMCKLCKRVFGAAWVPEKNNGVCRLCYAAGPAYWELYHLAQRLMAALYPIDGQTILTKEWERDIDMLAHYSWLTRFRKRKGNVI